MGWDEVGEVIFLAVASGRAVQQVLAEELDVMATPAPDRAADAARDAGTVEPGALVADE
ncbi:MAG: hypothetical protein U0841_22270 [Chloroflexia bacterium]